MIPTRSSRGWPCGVRHERAPGLHLPALQVSPHRGHFAARRGRGVAANLLGPNILGTGFAFDLYIRRGAVPTSAARRRRCSTAWRASIPSRATGRPTRSPTASKTCPRSTNVETLASVPQILRRSPEWYQGLGLGEFAGTKVVSLSGDVQRPGNYEVPFGLPLRTLLYDWAGGPAPGAHHPGRDHGRTLRGFLAGDDLEVTLDEPSIRRKGTFLGAAGIMVFDDSRDMVAVAHDGMAFFAHESCGKCFPCRIGTQRLTERLNSGGPADMATWQAEVDDITFTMKEVSAAAWAWPRPLSGKPHALLPRASGRAR
ncbi:MAG: NADH-ubiquinone oxidoreductase-F iron-sulfur binding region domain-containing protein [Caldilineaceae bacterium]